MAVYPPLESDQRCDALVVGGGITGAIVANALAEADIDTIVVDRRDIGHGSTSASTGLLQYEIDEPLQSLRDKTGKAGADRAYRMGVEAIDELERISRGSADFWRTPSVLAAKSSRDRAFLQREWDARREAGLDVEMLGERELRDRFGIHRPFGLVSSAAASVNPYALTHNLLQRSSGTAIRVFDRTTIENYRESRSGVIALTDRKFQIRCRRVFFATGFEVKRILSGNIVRLRSTYAFVSEPGDLSWWRTPCLVWETGDPYLYCRQCPDGRVLAGGEDDNVLNGPRRDAQTERKSKTIQRKFERLFGCVQIERAFWWSGVFGSTKDGLPYIGSHPEFPKGYFALGFGGNGITFSAMASRILRDHFLGRKNPDAHLYRFGR